MATAKKSKPQTTPKPKQATVREIMSFDFAMKNLLRDKANAGILEGFLSELLGRKVKVLAILESEGNIDDEDGKVNRVDIKAQIDGGEIAIFEIQYADQYDFIGKLLFNVSRAIVEQVGSGGKYNVNKVYMIGIAEYKIPAAKREYVFNAKIDVFKGIHYNETVPFSQTRGGKESPVNPALPIHPEYYLILPNMFDGKIRTNFDEWVHVLKNHEVKTTFKAAGLKEAAVKMDRLKMTPQQRAAYDRHLHNKTDIDTVYETGMSKGKAEGIVEGIAKGRAEGETKKAIEMARDMKKDGVDINTIAKYTKLTLAEIRRV